ncbi:MAG: hypothetical protein ACRD2A_17675 [Vicinamibacterales bacterium]
MLLKYPGLTIAGGLALAIAIGIGAGWYDLARKMLWPTIPLPEGDRIVVIETHNALTSRPELRVTRDFLEWRSDVRSIDGLGAYSTELRNLIVGNTPPVLIRTAALYGHRISHRACDSPDWSWAARRRREGRSAGRRRAGI